MGNQISKNRDREEDTENNEHFVEALKEPTRTFINPPQVRGRCDVC
jgi:hypothetical protein